MRRPWPVLGCCAREREKNTIFPLHERNYNTSTICQMKQDTTSRCHTKSLIVESHCGRYNRADLRCKKFGLCCSHLAFLFHCINRFTTEFLGCYECSFQYSVCHILLPLKFLLSYRPNCFFAICFAQQCERLHTLFL